MGEPTGTVLFGRGSGASGEPTGTVLSGLDNGANKDGSLWPRQLPQRSRCPLAPQKSNNNPYTKNNTMDTNLAKRILDLYQASDRNNTFYFTDFLPPADAAEAEAVIRAETGIPMDVIRHMVTAWGGAEGAERVMLRFGNADLFDYEVDFPIVTIKAEPLNAKFADELTHRDFLGALMNLGIERDVIGDIIVRGGTKGPKRTASTNPTTKEPEGTVSVESAAKEPKRTVPVGPRAYILAKDAIAPYIAENLTRVKHTSVMCTILTEAPVDIAPQFESLRLNVASERIDSLVARICNISRAKAQQMFSQHLISLDGRILENESALLKEGAVISIRGYGKYIFRGTEHETKKGRLMVLVDRYV